MFHSFNIKSALVEQTGHVVHCLFLDWSRAYLLEMISIEDFRYHSNSILRNTYVMWVRPCLIQLLNLDQCVSFWGIVSVTAQTWQTFSQIWIWPPGSSMTTKTFTSEKFLHFCWWILVFSSIFIISALSINYFSECWWREIPGRDKCWWDGFLQIIESLKLEKTCKNRESRY